MINVKSSVKIGKPVQEVYAFVNNPENTTKWQSGVEKVEYPPGAHSSGTQFTEVRKFMGREMKTKLEITALEINKRYSAKTLSGPVSYEVDVTFEAIGDETEMTTSIVGEAGGFFKLAEGMVAKQLKKSLEEDGMLLKSILEG